METDVVIDCQRGKPNTDPTYKEWKQIRLTEMYDMKNGHGSYLQGMETLVKRNHT